MNSMQIQGALASLSMLREKFRMLEMLYTPQSEGIDYARLVKIYQAAHSSGRRFIGVSEIARETGVSPDTVRNAMARAALQGVFERQDSVGGAVYQKAYYRPNLPEIERLLSAQVSFKNQFGDSILPVLKFITYEGGNLFDLWADEFGDFLPYDAIIFRREENRPQLISYAKRRAKACCSIFVQEKGFLQVLAKAQRDFIFSLTK